METKETINKLETEGGRLFSNTNHNKDIYSLISRLLEIHRECIPSIEGCIVCQPSSLFTSHPHTNVEVATWFCRRDE